ncbi:MAG: hypothetical protein Q9217_005851 [Psora testacea]
MKIQLVLNAMKTAAERYEEQYVHSVYESIAPHFSQTRHEPWPLITKFLRSLAPGSVGLDVGCGNGKYLGINPEIYIIGSDRSAALIDIAGRERRGRSNEVIVGDILDLPHRAATFDFAVSVAVVHHLSTTQRRVQAIGSIMETLRPPTEAATGGKALIYVWALEQKTSRRGWDEGHEQDIMVPWVMRDRANDGNTIVEGKTYERYYHLYRKGELERDVEEAGAIVTESGYEKDNWWVIALPKPPG